MVARIHLGLLMLAVFAFGVCDIRENEPVDGRRVLREILEDYQKATNKLKDEMLKTESAEYVAQNFVIEAPLERLDNFGPRFLRVADKHPRTDVAWEALRQVAYVRGFNEADKTRAMKLLIRDHSQRREFVDDLYFHHYRPGIDANRFCRLVIEDGTSEPAVLGLAKYTLAVGLSGVLANDEPTSEEDLLAATRLLKSVQLEHADVPHPVAKDKRTLGQAAADLEFWIAHLVVGRTAPEIVGQDVAGKEVRLSDYRGNVVLLVFCGEWCGPCRAMYPYEKEMVAEFGEKGLSILGVNSDPKETLKEAILREEFPWKWIWDGGSANGPIANRWEIRQWPTFILLDRDGVIRKKKFDGETIEQRAEAIRVQVAELLTKY